MKKHLTAEAEQQCRERIAQHNDNIVGWTEPEGFLIPTEPDELERVKTLGELIGARNELVKLLREFCGSDPQELLRLSWQHGRVVVSRQMKVFG